VGQVVTAAAAVESLGIGGSHSLCSRACRRKREARAAGSGTGYALLLILTEVALPGVRPPNSWCCK
jgi:hypothetical protein